MMMMMMKSQMKNLLFQQVDQISFERFYYLYLFCITDQNGHKTPVVIDPSKRERCPYGKFCYRKNPTHRQEAIHPGDPDWDNKENDTDDKKPECPYGSDCYRKNPDHLNEYSHTQKRSSINNAKRRTSKRKGSGDDDEDDDDGLPNAYDYNDSFIDDDELDDSARIDRAGI
jgi:hypothetical protein